jgi:hypothetical protein
MVGLAEGEKSGLGGSVGHVRDATPVGILGGHRGWRERASV